MHREIFFVKDSSMLFYFNKWVIKMQHKTYTTPKQDGFWMPGEFEPHAATFILWPERLDTWRDGAKPAQQVFSQIAEAIVQFEKVTVGVNFAQYKRARALLPESIRVVEISSDDAWIRDTGPTFVRNQEGEVRGVKWKFNAWGGLEDGLYDSWEKDQQVGINLCEIESKSYYITSDFILEGGSIHTDGQGTLLTTEACLLSRGRNSRWSKTQIEQQLQEYTGVDKVLWLPHGIYLDETNEHVDNICSFVRAGVVILAWCEEPTDPQFEYCRKCYEFLSRQTDAKGRSLKIIRLPLPKVQFLSEEESRGFIYQKGSKKRQAQDRLAASYINYYVCNGAVIVPQFGDEHDVTALRILQETYPDRKLMPVYTREILLGGGNIHCITQQEPYGESRNNL